MTKRLMTATLFLLPVLSYSGAAQDGKQQHIADLAYRAEMAHEGNDCTDSSTLEDRN